MSVRIVTEERKWCPKCHTVMSIRWNGHKTTLVCQNASCRDYEKDQKPKR